MSLRITKLTNTDIQTLIKVIRLFEDVFEMSHFEMPPNSHLAHTLAKQNFFVFAARMENEVVGGLTAYTLDQYYSEKPLAYIYDLAVSRDHQRRGVGRKLIKATGEFCRKHGFEEVFVQADKVDDHAIDFYRSTLPTEEEQVVHFYYTL
ncbi:MAG: GNAT family N-acetyltransferase [Bacteroidota bacterium]